MNIDLFNFKIINYIALYYILYIINEYNNNDVLKILIDLIFFT